MKVKKSFIIFIIAIIVLSIMKMLLVHNLPIAANVALGADDALMIRLTDNIVNGNWLGNYDAVVLTKGVTFPLILALCYFLNISYTTIITLLYTAACIYFIYVISKKISNKFLLTIIYAIVLFSPIMYCYQIMQRVYRSSLIPSFAIFIISGYTNLIFMKNENSIKKKLPTIIGLSIVLPLFWYTREDSIWIVPYIVFMTGALIIFEIIKNKKICKQLVKNILILFIPLIMICVYGNIQCMINYKYYGVYTIHNDEYYKKALNSMKKVKTYAEVERVSYSREKMDRLAQVTVFANVKGNFDMLADAYSKFDGNQQDNEVENGWFPWPFRDAVKLAGYYQNPQETNNFYNTLHVQIENAIQEGILEEEDEKVDLNVLAKIIKKAGEVFEFVFSYENVDTRFLEPTDYAPNCEQTYENFGKYTGNKYIYKLEDIPENEDEIKEQKEYIESIKTQDTIINNLIQIYIKITKILFIIAGILYVYMFVKMILDIINKNYELIDMWIVVSGILGAMLTLILGIAYETVLNAPVVTAMYLAGAYPLMLMFSLVTICYMGIYIFSKIKNKEEKSC